MAKDGPGGAVAEEDLLQLVPVGRRQELQLHLHALIEVEGEEGNSHSRTGLDVGLHVHILKQPAGLLLSSCKQQSTSLRHQKPSQAAGGDAWHTTDLLVSCHPTSAESAQCPFRRMVQGRAFDRQGSLVP